MLGDTARMWRGSPMDEQWARCHPDSPWYSGEPLCIVPQQANLWFPRGYTVNGAVFNLAAGLGWATPPRMLSQLPITKDSHPNRAVTQKGQQRRNKFKACWQNRTHTYKVEGVATLCPCPYLRAMPIQHPRCLTSLLANHQRVRGEGRWSG